MADPFVAEIRLFPFFFSPRGWARCDGQLMPLSQNTALFSLLGTNYGGNGKSNFALPDLQGRAPMHPGQGPGLSLRNIGESGGSDAVVLLESQIPSHTHTLSTVGGTPTSRSPASATWAGNARSPLLAYSDAATDSVMSAHSTSAGGGGHPHNNMQPYLAMCFCIALQGVYPPRD